MIYILMSLIAEEGSIRLFFAYPLNAAEAKGQIHGGTDDQQSLLPKAISKIA
jgi:hypothetical protein